MFGFFQLLVNAVIYLTPIFVLPFALCIDYHICLKLSIGFCTYHFIAALFRVLTKNKLDSITWLIELPLFFGISLAVYFLIPHFVLVAFGNLLIWAGPFLLLFQSIQMVRVIMYGSDRSVTKIYESPEKYETLVKLGVISISIASYLVCGLMVYHLYQHPAMNVGLSSYVAVLCTAIITLSIIVVFFVEQGILSDIALISLFVVFYCKKRIYGNTY